MLVALAGYHLPNILFWLWFRLGNKLFDRIKFFCFLQRDAVPCLMERAVCDVGLTGEANDARIHVRFSQ